MSNIIYILEPLVCCVRFERLGFVRGGCRRGFCGKLLEASPTSSQCQAAPGWIHHWPSTSLCCLQGGGRAQEGERGEGKVILRFKDLFYLLLSCSGFIGNKFNLYPPAESVCPQWFLASDLSLSIAKLINPLL